MSSRTFLITGAARGIGRGLSRLLLQNGHRVYLLDNNVEELTHTIHRLESLSFKIGEHFFTDHVDIRDPAQIKTAVDTVKKEFAGHLDCLINNAAYTNSVGQGTTLEGMTVEEWNKSIETNLTAPMLLSQACLPMLRRSKGCIIHVSSTRAFQAEPNHEAYSATKAGLIGLMQSMAVSLAPDQIRVNAILPGWIHVENENKKADEAGIKWEEGLTQDDMKWQLTGRVGKVEDIEAAVRYLVESDGVTGVEMVVDGGVTRKMVYPE